MTPTLLLVLGLAPSFSDGSLRDDPRGRLLPAPMSAPLARAIEHVTGDWNGDGRPDALVLTTDTPGTDAVHFFLGAPGGRLRETERAWPTDGTPLDAVVLDLDGDGADEALVSVERRAGEGYLLLFRGVGSAGAWVVEIPLGFVPWRLALGDVHGDGRLDLVLADRTGVAAGTPGPRIVVWEGIGAGDFRPGAAISVSTPPDELQVADLDGDGRGEVLFFQARTNDLHVLREGSETVTAVGPAITDLATLDVDGDGDLEIVVGGSSVEIWETGDEGNLVLREALPITASGSFTTWVSVGDLDGDRLQDLVVSMQQSTQLSGPYLIRGEGGGFAPPERIPGDLLLQPEPVDLDGDGDLDLLGRAAGGPLVSWLGRGDGSFVLPLLFGAEHGHGLAVVDLDADGRPEVVASEGFEDQVVVWSGSTSEGFERAVELPTGRQPTDLALGDFDGDGRLDVAAIEVDGDFLRVWANRGGLSLEPLVARPFVFPYALASGDLDEDGLSDTVVGGIGRFATWLAGPDVESTTSTSFSVGGIALADVDGDGHLDLLAADTFLAGTSTTYLFAGRGDGSFGAPLSVVAGYYAQEVRFGDWNLDGSLDVALSNNGLGSTGSLGLAPGDGLGAFGPPTTLFTGPGVSAAEGSDVDLDGLPDLTILSADAFVLRNTGGARFAQPDGYQLPGYPTSYAALAWADLSGDGLPDLAFLPFTVSVHQGPATAGSMLSASDLRPRPGRMLATDR